jgi:hypothetical protein
MKKKLDNMTAPKARNSLVTETNNNDVDEIQKDAKKDYGQEGEEKRMTLNNIEIHCICI